MKLDAAEVYERVKAACCPFHGFPSDDMLEAHVRAITLTILELARMRAA